MNFYLLIIGFLVKLFGRIFWMAKYTINDANNVTEERFTAGAIFVNLWKGFSWLLLMVVGAFICCMP